MNDEFDELAERDLAPHGSDGGETAQASAPQVPDREPKQPVHDPAATDSHGDRKEMQDNEETTAPATDTSGTALQVSTSEGKAQARLTEIELKFDGAQLTELQKTELALEYLQTYEELHFGHDVRKGPGRPGIIAEVARRLALPGKSDEAKRKWLAASPLSLRRSRRKRRSLLRRRASLVVVKR